MKRAFLLPFLLLWLSVAAYAQPSTCAVTAHIYATDGSPVSAFTITVVKVIKNGVLISTGPRRYTTASDGTVTIPLPQSSTAWVEAAAYNLNTNGRNGVPLSIPATSTANLE